MQKKQKQKQKQDEAKEEAGANAEAEADTESEAEEARRHEALGAAECDRSRPAAHIDTRRRGQHHEQQARKQRLL